MRDKLLDSKKISLIKFKFVLIILDGDTQLKKDTVALRCSMPCFPRYHRFNSHGRRSMVILILWFSTIDKLTALA